MVIGKPSTDSIVVKDSSVLHETLSANAWAIHNTKISEIIPGLRVDDEPTIVCPRCRHANKLHNGSAKCTSCELYMLVNDEQLIISGPAFE